MINSGQKGLEAMNPKGNLQTLIGNCAMHEVRSTAINCLQSLQFVHKRKACLSISWKSFIITGHLTKLQ